MALYLTLDYERSYIIKKKFAKNVCNSNTWAVNSESATVIYRYGISVIDF